MFSPYGVCYPSLLMGKKAQFRVQVKGFVAISPLRHNNVNELSCSQRGRNGVQIGSLGCYKCDAAAPAEQTPRGTQRVSWTYPGSYGSRARRKAAIHVAEAQNMIYAAAAADAFIVDSLSLLCQNCVYR